MKHTVTTVRRQKSEGGKIAMLTVYDYSTAKLMDAAGIEILLVGDSLGNTVLGYPDTLSVTMEDMIHHSGAVARGTENALVVTDMPFMSYQASVYDAVTNAGRLVKEGRAQAVKLEGGRNFCQHIKAITEAQIPVMAHLGLTPQSVNAFGGFKVQGKDDETAVNLIDDALAVEAAGAFALVLECVPTELAALVTGLLSIPTIGIGAGGGTDGQVLVYQDMLAMYGGKSPKFAKVFADVGALMQGGFRAYLEETKNGAFPDEAHGFCIDPGVMGAAREHAGRAAAGARTKKEKETQLQ
ncbi:MAG: 3-methyl-2-oxobutanoate hydroxymethyltransferase [Clostridiales Family XIII bacterium]|jgi:3-methyl-2-oxobutanoate hydroxymethyltransferase|nr:3-methyl-2-oxobutanoate hydroxymethyltransferase [Clostridiales Family XIII bacterium]